jgi:transcriptional regulator with XRE-family HTH domain
MTAEQLRLIRLLNGMTQRTFADRLNLSRPLITMIERGERSITEKTRRRVMEAFKMNDEKLSELQRARELMENGN